MTCLKLPANDWPSRPSGERDGKRRFLHHVGKSRLVSERGSITANDQVIAGVIVWRVSYSQTRENYKTCA
jgi:hypothetical protein